MKCRYVSQNLTSYIDGATDKKMKIDISDHLSLCEACLHEYNLKKMQIDLLSKMPIVEPSDYFDSAFFKKLQETKMGDANENPDFASILKPILSRWKIPSFAVAMILIFIFAFNIYKVNETHDVQEFQLAANLEMFEDYELVLNLDLLANLEVLADPSFAEEIE
ncbi:MAG: hypothetical protein ABIA04_11370 [Pseudomonadota bacterium]